jgi:hypothetical protein
MKSNPVDWIVTLPERQNMLLFNLKERGTQQFAQALTVNSIARLGV